MTHLTRGELLAWRDTPSAADRERIVGHLAECDECAAAYAELIRTRPAEAATSGFDARAFAERGYSAREQASPKPFVWGVRFVVPLAAAAVILLAVVLPRQAPQPQVTLDVDAVRGSRLEAVSPAGEISGPLEFRWTSPFNASRYVVEVTDADGRTVLRRDAQTERLIADDAIERAVRPGGRYSWTVAALDRAGDVIARSEPREFSRAGGSR